MNKTAQGGSPESIIKELYKLVGHFTAYLIKFRMPISDAMIARNWISPTI